MVRRLVFIGLGLAPGQLTLEGQRWLGRANRVVVDDYTSRLLPDQSSALEYLREQTEAEITFQPRSGLEGEQASAWLDGLPDGISALAVVGDPFTATTHRDLHLRALERGIEVVVCPAPSVATVAAGACGLDFYKFGRTVSLPRPLPNFRPTSPRDAVQRNLDLDLHTLVLLDLDPTDDYFMQVPEAVDLLQGLRGSDGAEPLLVGLARLGQSDQQVVAAPGSVLRQLDLGSPLHCVIVPSRLHFKEAEALMALAGAQRAWVEKRII